MYVVEVPVERAIAAVPPARAPAAVVTAPLTPGRARSNGPAMRHEVDGIEGAERRRG